MMKHSQTFFPLAASLGLAITVVTPSFGEIPPLAGTVTHVFGTATLQHGKAGEPRPIKFKDKVYIQDSITTKEDSVVRVLMGNKALVTISEMSVLTITEEVNHATLDVESGAISLSVARKRMNPGEYIEIRTPHAVAAIRGTKLVTEVANKHSSRFDVLEGKVDVAYHRANPRNKFPINPHQSFEFFKQKFRKGSHVRKLRRNRRGTLAGKPALNAHHLLENVDSPAESKVADMQMAKATELAKQMVPETYHVENLPEQTAYVPTVEKNGDSNSNGSVIGGNELAEITPTVQPTEIKSPQTPNSHHPNTANNSGSAPKAPSPTPTGGGSIQMPATPKAPQPSTPTGRGGISPAAPTPKPPVAAPKPPAQPKIVQADNKNFKHWNKRRSRNHRRYKNDD